MDFDINHKELEIEALDFQVPHSQLAWLSKKLQGWFPDYIPPHAASLLAEAKQEGELKGRLNLQKSRHPATLSFVWKKENTIFIKESMRSTHSSWNSTMKS